MTRQALDGALTIGVYGAPLTTREGIRMLRDHPSQRPATIPDTELGVSALLLLLTVVLAVVLVPGII